MSPKKKAEAGEAQAKVRSRAEQYAAGKALRDTCPRDSHATWKPHKNRRDALDMVQEPRPATRRSGSGWIVLSLLLTGCDADAGARLEARAAQAASASASVQAAAAQPTVEQLQQATISGIYDMPITLTRGAYEGRPFVSGGAARPGVRLWSNLVAYGALDDQPGEEAAVLLSETSGGSGEFVYLAVMANRNGRVVNLGTVGVGDRVKVRTVRILDRRILMDVVEAGPGEAMCCPTLLAQKAFAVHADALRLESSTVTGTLSVATMGQMEWTLVEMDGKALPAGATPPTIRFDGLRASGFAGCNRFTGSVEDKGAGAFTFGPLAATRMACAGPQDEIESRFVARLGTVSRFSFVAGRLALTDGRATAALVFEAKPIE